MKDDVEQICKIFKAFCLAVPFQNNMLSPHAMFNGNIICRNIGEFTTVTEDNYNEIVSQLADEAIERAKTTKDPIIHLFYYLTSPYYIQFLYFIKDVASQKTLSELVSYAWVHMEFPNQSDIAMLIDLFKMCNMKFMMDDAELRKYLELPSLIQIYRGLQTKKAKRRALSWTLSPTKAQWFANRWKLSGDVLSAQIPKQHVFAVFLGRNEEEVVVNPRYLKNVCKMTDLENIMK